MTGHCVINMAEIDNSVLDVGAEGYSPQDSNDEVDSLPSTDTDDSIDNHDYESDAEREWRESMKQLELLLTIFVLPYFGKYFGRKAAYWGKFSDIYYLVNPSY